VTAKERSRLIRFRVTKLDFKVKLHLELEQQNH